MTGTFPEEFTIDIQREVQVQAPAAIVFEAILEQAGPGMIMPDGVSMDMKLEAWPGGRWFRDLGNNTGHLWGHVQVIKPPKLLEISGPMFMSYPVASHIQYKLVEKSGVTTLSFSHRAFGQILADHRTGVIKGWDAILNDIKKRATR